MKPLNMEASMKLHLSGALIGIICLLPVSAQAKCEYASQSYGTGSTICECPSLKGPGGTATGGDAKITSRRLTCSKDGRWESANSFCLDLDYERTAGVAVGDFPKFQNLYCPTQGTLKN